MKKSTLIMILSLIMAVAVGMGSTVAYLQDTDEDVNVMTLGKVYITQNEQERVDATKLPTEDNLKEFSQEKPLYPAVFEGSSIPWDAASEADQAWKVIQYNENAVDKFVTVTNSGTADAYVRTLIAFEGDETYGPEGAYIHTVSNGSNVADEIRMEYVGVATIDEVKYTVYEYTYLKALAPEATTIPSLKQVYMNHAATNDVIEQYGDQYDILVLSQAVQTKGFADPDTALNAAFGDTNVAKVEEWFANIGKNIGSPGDKWIDNNPPIFPVNVTNADELEAALANAEKGDLIVLAEGEYGHVAIESTLEDVVIEVEEDAVVFFDITSEAKLDDVTIVGLNGTYPEVTGNSVAYVDGGVVNIDAGAEVSGLVIEDADLVLSGGRSSMVGNSEPSADVTIKESTIKGSKYLVYGYSPMANLTIEGNNISNISSWLVMENAGDSVGAKLTITGNTFDACTGGMAKYLGSSQPDGAATVFTNNTLTNCKGHDGSDAKWFTIPGATSTITVSGNTLDGAAFEPGTAQGLGK